MPLLAIADRELADVDPRRLSTTELVRHIVSRHHQYLRDMLPFVQVLAHRVARVHGQQEPKLVELSGAVAELRATLEPHLDDEERSLFPALVANAGVAVARSKDLRALQDEHLHVEEMVKQLRALSNDFVVPDWASTSYRTLMRELEKLEADTLAHVHTENHVLMARFV